MVKNLPRCRRSGFDPWVRKILWRREQISTPIFLPGEFHGQKSLMVYSPWSCKDVNATELLPLLLEFIFILPGCSFSIQIFSNITYMVYI